MMAGFALLPTSPDDRDAKIAPKRPLSARHRAALAGESTQKSARAAACASRGSWRALDAAVPDARAMTSKDRYKLVSSRMHDITKRWLKHAGRRILKAVDRSRRCVFGSDTIARVIPMDRTTEEILCSVQAQVFAQRIALRALVRTHPDPAGLLAAWHEALTESAACCPVVPAGSRHSDYLADQVRGWAEDWTAELVELAVTTPDRSMSNAIVGFSPQSIGDGHAHGRRR